MNTNEELKTRLKTEFMNRFTYEAGDGFRMNPSPTTPEKVLNWIYTHVEPLQAENDKLKKFKDYVHNQRDLKSENQKLRDLLKDAHETLIIASLIDKSNTCRDSAARIDAFLKTNP